MKRIILFLPMFFLSLLIIASCNKSDSPFSPESVGYGSLKSKVHPRTELTDINSTDTVDYSGCNIAIEGTSFSMITDTSGMWMFTGIPEGKYAVSFSKPGYSAYKLLYATVIKEDTSDYPVYLYKPTSAKMSNINYILSAARINFTYKLNVNVLRQYFVRFFFSSDSTIGTPASNYTFTEYEMLIDVNDTVSYRDHYVEVTTLRANGFTSGQRVYFYANVGYKNQYYTDSASGRKIYNSLSLFPTARQSFILP